MTYNAAINILLEGGRVEVRQWRMTSVADMTTVADDDNTRDWVADCDGEGRERAVRDGGDSRVVMMAATAEDGNGRQ